MVTYLATDQTKIVHIVTRNADGWWTSECGVSTGAPEYQAATEKRRAGYLLTLMSEGCVRCAERAVPTPSKREAYR